MCCDSEISTVTSAIDMRCTVRIWRLVGHKSVGRILSLFSRSCGTKPVSALHGRVDRYNGIHVDIGAVDVPTNKHFLAQLRGKDCIFRSSSHMYSC